MSRITIKQVAVQAGVSYQTVSKVLNRQAVVSKETEERIWRAVRTLGYHPNSIARSLRSQRSRLIGYSWKTTSPDLANPILDLLMQSMADRALQRGYKLLIFPYQPEREWIKSYLELIETNQVDAFVLSGVEYNDSRLLLLQERRFPFVAFGRSNPDDSFPYVDVDGAAGMRRVVEHCIECGRRRIFALALPSDSRVGQNRMDGYIAGLHAAGLFPPEEWIARGEGNYQFGFQATTRWLNWPESQRPEAVVAFNDLLAVGAIHALQAKGLQAGIDISVTGFEDTPIARYILPGLTSVRQPIWEIGQQVIALLMNILDGIHTEERQSLLEPELIIRESSSIKKIG